MAYQPKSYRKFVATTATAAMVASAVAPVVSAAGFTDVAPQYKDAIDFLVSTGATNGKTPTKFGVYDEITRLDAAVILAKVLKLDVDNAKDAGFTDVPKDRAKYVNALVEAGVLNGKAPGKFGAYDKLTRVEMAKIIANAYNLKGDDVTLPFTDVNDTWAPFVKALYKNGVTKGKTETKFGAYENITRGDFARFVYNAHNATVAPEVTAVSAINPTTLKLEGEGLKNLKAENVTVVGNKVVAITPAADGKSATVTLESKLVPNEDVTVSVTVNGEKKDFTVKFEYKVTSVSVDPQTFDDDRAGQKVTFRVNGESAAADIDYLKLAGYNINFVAIDKATGATADIFTDGAGGTTSTSSTGILATDLSSFVGKEIEIQVQLSKSGEALVSNKAIVKFVNLDAATTAVDSVVFAVDKDTNGVAYNADGSTDLAGTDFALNSTTLVAGEVAGIYQVKATINGSKEIVAPTAFSVESSNPAVISYNSDTGLLTAESAGTATITVKVGEVKKTFTFKVVNEERKLAKVVANPSTLKIVKGHTNTVEVKTLDQYGDPFAVTSDDVEEVVPMAGSTPIVTAASVDVDTDAEGSIGKVTLTVAGNEVGKGTVYFKDATTDKVLGSLFVDVTAVNNVGSQKLEIVKVSGQSEDNTLDLLADNKVTYKLANYNTNGVYRDDENLNGYVLEVVDGTVAQVTDGTNTTAAEANATITAGDVTTFDIIAVKAGKTDVLVKKSDGTVVGKITITVVNDPIKITGVNWKQLSTIDYIGETINYKDVLSITDSNADDIVNNITLSKSTAYKVRIAESAGNEGIIYLDKDADGAYDAGEELGWLELSKTSDSSLGDITNAITGYTTAANDKGTLVFKVYVDADGDGTYEPHEAIAATSVKVEVK
jgi:S-layer homology domain